MGSFKGIHWSKMPNAEEIRARISATKKIRPTKYWSGKTHSQETRDKISASKISSQSTVRGANHHKFIDGTRAPGYKSIKENGESKLAHRKIAEKALGRLLNQKEIIHHWDENKKNNKLPNLALLRSRSAHIRLHAYSKRHGIPMVSLKFEQPWLFTHT